MYPGSRPESSASWGGRRRAVALGALTLGAFGLRLVHLTRFELFVDEAATWWFARLTAGGRLAEQMSLEPTPPLYYGLVGLLMKVFGESDLVLRLPSAVFGAAAVPLVFALGKATFGSRAGAFAAGILAIHPLHVFYSREARVYPLLLCLTLWTLLSLWRALETDGMRAWAVFSSALILVCYSHFYGLFLALTAALAVVLLGRGAAMRWRGLLATGAAMLVFAPYVAGTLPHLKASGAAWSIETFYQDFPQEKQLGRVFETQLIGADYHPYLRQLDRPETPVALRAGSVLAQLVLLAAALCFAAGRGRRRALAFLVLAWTVPILAPWTVTQAGRAIFHSGRHDVYALGGLCVLLGAGLEGLIASASSRRRLLQVVAAAAMASIVAGAAFRLVSLHRTPAPSHHRAAGAWIALHAGPEDRVMAMGIRRLVSERYARLAGSRARFESFPSSTDSHPGWSDVMTLMDDQEALHREARGRIDELSRRLPEGASLLLLLRRYQRTAGAVSVTWLVDRHVLENLHASGWQPAPGLRLEGVQIDAFRPPATRVRSEE